MNLLVFIAGIIAALATIGHFTMGTKLYLRPLLSSEVDPIVKTIFKSVFHYSSIFLLTSTIVMLNVGFRGVNCVYDSFLIMAFFSVNYLLMGIWQLIIALRSGIQKPLLSIFQWMLWLIIGGLVLSSLVCVCN